MSRTGMVVATTALVEALQGIVGGEHARLPRSDDMRFVVDGLKPSVEVTPGSYEEVAAVMRYANEGGLAVIPQGHGAVTWVGNVPRRYDIALSVARLNAIVEYEPADLTISCQAGATITELNVPLSGNRQMIPFAANSASCVGRLLALPMRESNLTWGSVRDFTIGLRVVTADGRIVRTGGKVVKNVAGYDLTKLFLGSMGTLGVIVEASFKLAPAPQEEATLNFEFPSVADGCGFVLALPEPGFSLSHVMMTRTMALSDRGASPRGLIRFSIRLSGTSAAVARSSKEIGQLARSSGGSKDVAKIPDHRDPLPAWTRAADPLTCHVTVLPSLVPSLIEAVDDDAPGAFVESFPLAGYVALTWLGAGNDEQLVRGVQAAVSSLGGTMVINCSTELKRQIDVFGDPPPSLELMRRIKDQFDPNGILSPGRFVGKL